MKKNISINISGIIFHIEEDGYENLRRYLDSINKYFSGFEDSSEIMADIESRIAEIFLSKLNEGKQVITADDVQALMATMGSVNDFKAAEAQDTPSNDTRAEQQSSYTTADDTANENPRPAQPQNLSRDQRRKILGGVCAGLASYMRVDPLWVRLVFALFAFAWGIAIFIYLVMWIVVPGTYDLQEYDGGKKMYRDPERKVIGGVAGGIASFLNIDVIAVRVLFIVLTITGGLGLFVYIILWVILPEARTLTERMQMQGEPVTLSNIESNIKKNQGADGAEESTLTKILLFPFRILGVVLQALGKVLLSLAEVMRVVIGIMVALTGIGFVLTVVIGGGIMLGLITGSSVSMPGVVQFDEVSIPVNAMLRAFPSWIAIAGFLAALVPSIFVMLLGVSIVARRMVFGAPLGWSLFVIFFVSMALLSIGVPKIIYAFKETGEHQIERVFNPSGKTFDLKLREVGMDDYFGASLSLEGYDGKEIKLVQKYKAQGSTRQKAIENARMVDYTVTQQDSVMTFDSNVQFKPEAVFRDQRVHMTLYIPYHKPFTMDEGVCRFIRQYIEEEKGHEQTWEMTEKGLTCVSCPAPSVEEQEAESMADLRDFEELDLRGYFDVRIYQGSDYSVEIHGDEAEKKKYKIYRSGKTLVVEVSGKKSFNWNFDSDKLRADEIRLNITMPDLKKLEAIGVGTIRFDQFNNQQMDIDIKGPIDVRGELETQELDVTLSAKAELDISGHTQKLNAELEMASNLKAYDLEAQDARIEVKGASHAKVQVNGTLEIEKGVASDVDYHGNAKVIQHQ